MTIEKLWRIAEQLYFDLRDWKRGGSSGTTNRKCPVLGLMWDPYRDCLMLTPQLIENGENVVETPITKRHILSVIQRLFDPIAPTCHITSETVSTTTLERNNNLGSAGADSYGH